MGLPSILKNFTGFVDGDSYLGEFEEIGLGKIAEKMETIRPGGLLGEIDVPIGLDKFEVDLKSTGLNDRLMAKFGKVGVASTLLRFVGAYQEDVEGGVKQGELIVRGRIPELDPGSSKIGKGDGSVKFTGVYLKWTVSGRVLIELDWLNLVYLVDGNDRYAETRAAMGL